MIYAIMEMSHRNDSVDDVLLTTKLNSHTETRIEIKKTLESKLSIRQKSRG